MPIPESQLETWSHQGAITTSKATHEAIRRGLDADSVLSSKDLAFYLQGSYKNDTNIYASSDVDLVVQLNDTFYYDVSLLPSHEQSSVASSIIPASYPWEQFRADVLRVLTAVFGTGAVTPGSKSIKLAAAPGRQPADVIPAAQHRRYISGTRYVEGIQFFADGWRPVVNFPKQHYENGVAKHSAGRTGNGYKPTIRMFKNARNAAISRGLLSSDQAPSYFVECLLYNVPDRHFPGTYRASYAECINWLSAADLSDFVCQNDLVFLFGSSTEQWSTTAARGLIDALACLWDTW